MEAIGLMTCALGVWGASWCALAGGSARHVTGWRHRLAVRRLRELCALLGAQLPVTLLLRSSAWCAAADAIQRSLVPRGVLVGRREACAMLLLSSLVGSVTLAVSSASPIGFVIGLLATLVAVPLWDSSRRRARERALVDEMPEVFRTLAMALGSGETLTQAVEYVGMHERGYAGEAFSHAALRLRCGASTEEAMRGLADELDAPGVGLLTTALVIAQRTGSPLRSLFQSSARLVERQGEYERMLAVKTAQVRLSVRVVSLLPLLLVGVLSLISVDFQHGLATVPGTMSVLVAAAMDAVALLIIRRLMEGVL